MKFKIPQTLADLSVEKLQGLEVDAVAAFDELKADPELDANGLTELKAIAKFVGDVRAELANREQADAAAATQLAEELAAADALVHPQVDDTATDEPDETEETPETAETGKTPVLAGGAARQAAARGNARRGPAKPAAEEQQYNRVTAAADLPKIGAGTALTSVDDIAAAFEARSSTFPRSRAGTVKTRLKQGVATIERAVDPRAVVADGKNFWQLMEEISSEKSLPNGNLIAAGGWCAPNVRVWDLCPGLETAAGIADFPSFTLQRGGIEYPEVLDFADIYSNANLGFHQTEADSIAGTDKVCYTIPCPSFAAARLEVDGICFSQDIVQNSVWPELTRDVMRRALVAHEHKINARLLTQVFTISAASSTAFVLTLGTDVDGDETTTGVLGAVSLMGVHYRYQYRMDPNATLEGFAPFWLRDVIRSDMARRAGVSFYAVTNAEIDSWFAARGIRLQFVYDLQDSYVGAATDIGGTGFAAAAQWPAEVKVALFAAGTWTKGGNGIIDLSAVYDSTGLKDNTFVSAFTEESVLLLRRCNASYVATIPLCPTGVTGSTVGFDCSAV